MLQVNEGKFLLNNEPFQLLSGALHYFRIVPDYWEDRLLKMKACGLNTVETYVPWNMHEPQKGEFQFEGLADLEAFIKKAEEIGLYVIVRPSPYICAEWEFGGLPGWLLKEKDVELRCSHPSYLKHLDDYYDVLLPKIVPHLSTNGGPVIAVQIENEYGGYGNDENYLTFMKEALVSRGIDVLLFTSDGPEMIQSGSLPDVLTTLNFGSRSNEAFQKLEDYKPGSPKLCAEFWIGWFDHWGGEHHTRDGEDVAKVLDDMLKVGASVNFYMFHGGTNFGFYNGANHYETYSPTITSYDYDALLTESGDFTDKYEKVKDVMRRYVELPEVEIPEIKKNAYGTVELSEQVSLFDTLSSISEKVVSAYPLSMEQLHQNFGFTLYKTSVSFKGEVKLDITPIRDRAFVYVNGIYQQTIYRNDEEKMVSLSLTKEDNVIELLVENMGRVNYGKHLKDAKGIIGPLWMNNQYVFHWEMYPIELTTLPTLFNEGTDERYPKFYRGTLEVNEQADTFVQLKGWTKGNVFINGINLGRYWSVGPQETLYVPGPLLKQGTNEVIVFELEGNETNEITFIDTPKLG
ncbi:beta-galactosidase [Bacillus sp. CGMCC 1.16541]|uniref:glycoside hydrolase family 35 protein n=1 Tax=Bacillus sp. CGMCC 1.16541 TaxID=2185143 RepID=UPI000D7306A3|nr:beta-galactosidase [Bacillus sp. CGMCC 1.16541]